MYWLALGVFFVSWMLVDPGPLLVPVALAVAGCILLTDVVTPPDRSRTAPQQQRMIQEPPRHVALELALQQQDAELRALDPRRDGLGFTPSDEAVSWQSEHDPDRRLRELAEEVQKRGEAAGAIGVAAHRPGAERAAFEDVWKAAMLSLKDAEDAFAREVVRGKQQ